MSQKDLMPFTDHLEELRNRIVITGIFFVIASVVGLFISQPLIRIIQNASLLQDIPMNAFSPADPFKIYMKMSFLLGFIITIPMILYQMWAFISPGLLERERKITLTYIPIAFILFIAGICFSYFILFPFVIKFMVTLSENMDIQTTIGINEYFQFLFQITIPFGLLFQLPVVMLFITRLGIITPQCLVKIRKYAYFVLLVIAGIITPPDLISHLMVTVPLFILYEISLFISKIGYKQYVKVHNHGLQEM